MIPVLAAVSWWRWLSGGLVFSPMSPCSDAQKKSAATPAAEYKKTDEAQPDVKEEEEEAEEAETPGWNAGGLGVTSVVS